MREARKLPVILSREEVARLIACAPGPGLKYKATFSVAYGAGLRVSKVAALKIDDIDSERMLIRIEQGKGKNLGNRAVTETLADHTLCLADH